MEKLLVKIIVIFFLLSNFTGYTCSPFQIDKKIIQTTFYSPIVDDSIKLDISLPESYANNPDRKYQVLYLTDGYWRRGEHDTIHKMGSNNDIQELIIVGIGYPDDYNFAKVRIKELIMHSSKFLQCIKNEIIPYIEHNYNTDSLNRTLWGSSYGGHFLIYAFTQHIKAGKLFSNYICASPALDPPFIHEDLLKNENELWETTKELPVKLYITVGGDEDQYFISSYNKLVKQISSHLYEGFRFDYMIIPSTHHYTVWKPALLNGLKLFLGKMN